MESLAGQPLGHDTAVALDDLALRHGSYLY